MSAMKEARRAVGRFAREHPWLCLAHLVASIAVLVPLWSVEYLPLLDWPQHLAMVSALRHLHDDAWGFDRYYHVDLTAMTYIGFYYTATVLSYVVSVEAALRILLSFAVIGTPLGLAYALHAYGRSPWAALLGYVAIYSWPLYMGFGAYLMGIPFLFVGLGLVEKLSERPTRGHMIAMAVVSSALFLTHALAYVLFLAVAGVAVIAFNVRDRRTLLRSIVALAPSLALFAAWFVVNFLQGHEDRFGAGFAQINGLAFEQGTFGAVYEPWEEKVDRIFYYFNEGFRDALDEEIAHYWAMLVAALVVVSGAIAIARWRRWLPPSPAGPRAWRPMLVGVLLAGLYFATPMEVSGIWAVSPRMILLGACGLTFFVGALLPRDWMNAMLLVPVLLLALHTAEVNRNAFVAVQDEVGELREVLGSMERGRRTYGLMFDSGSRTMSQAIFLHYGTYYMIERGGLTGFTFAHTLAAPLRLHDVALAPFPGRRGEWEPWRWRYDLYGPFYDYLLVRGPSGALPMRIGAPPGALRLVTSNGPWSVFENTRPSPGRAVLSLREVSHRARVVQVTGNRREPCGPWDGQRTRCPHADWTWVGPSEQTYQNVIVPCIWAHPIAGSTLEITFDDLPRATVLRGLYGIADSGQRGGGGLPVLLRVRSGRHELGRFETTPSSGYRTFEIALSHTRKITFEVSIVGDSDAMRHYCFGGTLFDEPG